MQLRNSISFDKYKHTHSKARMYLYVNLDFLRNASLKPHLDSLPMDIGNHICRPYNP